LGAANADGAVAKMSARESAIFELVNIVCLGCAEVNGLPYETNIATPAHVFYQTNVLFD